MRLSFRFFPFFLGGSSAVATALVLPGCAAPPRSALHDTRAEIADRLGYEAAPDQDAEIAGRVASLLARPLTGDSAAQVALLSNGDLRAGFAEIGISQADWVEAGLLRNPVLDLGFEIPTTPPSATRVQGSFTESFLSLLTLPRRKAVAADRLDAVRLRVADQALRLVAETKEAVYEFQAEALLDAALEGALNLEQSSAELSRLQYDAGNVPEFELSLHRVAFDEMRLTRSRLHAERAAQRERLQRLLGVSTVAWTVAPALDDLPVDEPARPDLEKRAVRRRFDLAAAKADYAAAARTLGLSIRYRLADGLDVGADFERDVTGQKSLGPTFALPLPLFDSGQARVERSRAQLRQAAARLDRLALVVRSEVREKLGDLRAAREAVLLYRDSLVPERRRLVILEQQRYNGMLVGVYDLIQAKQNELAAARGEIEARRDYWIARAELEAAAGGGLSPVSSSSATPSP